MADPADQIRAALRTLQSERWVPGSRPWRDAQADALAALDTLQASHATLQNALRETFELAAVSVEGDPWFAKQANLDADAIMARARAALPNTEHAERET